MLNLKQDARMLSSILMVICGVMAIPALLAYGSAEYDALRGFIITIIITLAIGAALRLIARTGTSRKLGMRDGYLLVTVSWLTVTGLGALPLVISGAYPSYTSAYFEMMSGFTTTGASLISDASGLPSSIHFWRSATNWLGGMGIIVLFVALVPTLGSGGAKLVGAEFVGPTKDKLTPKIRNTALSLWLIYVGLSVLQTILLLGGGVSLYDAATITFSTMGAAGFTAYAMGTGSFSQTYVLVVITVFMFLSGVNFSLFFKVLTGRGRKLLQDDELKTYTLIILGVSILGAISLVAGNHYTPVKALGLSVFHTVSMMTTTGFVTANYQAWPAFNQMLVFLLVFVGGCSGSAAGGFKVIRVMTMSRLSRSHIRQRLHPDGVFPVHINKTTLAPTVLRGVTAYFGLYFLTALLGMAVISLAGLDFETTVSSVLICLSNVGIGLGKVGPTGSFAVFPAWTHWIFAFLMLIGRLEFFTVFTVLSRDFWKK